MIKYKILMRNCEGGHEDTCWAKGVKFAEGWVFFFREADEIDRAYPRDVVCCVMPTTEKDPCEEE